MRYISSNRAAVTKRGCDGIKRAAARWMLGIGGTIAILGADNSARAAGAVNVPDSVFPIGVWSQPLGTFDKWQSRGINTVINYEPYGGTNTIDQWSDAANAHSFY